MNIGKTKKLKGFTLLELIVVIAIIGVLLMIAVPNMQTYMRMNRMQAANDKAQEVYMATQDYLTKLQTSGVSVDNLKKYFGYDSSSKTSFIGVDMSASKGSAEHPNCETSGGSVICTRTVHYDDILTTAPGADNADEKTSKAVLAANGIASRLSENFDGAWIVVIYPETFTVRYAVYSEQPNREKTSSDVKRASCAYNYGGVEAVGDPVKCDNSTLGYKTTVGLNTTYTANNGSYRHSSSQEADYTDATYAGCAYTGQYPIPFS